MGQGCSRTADIDVAGKVSTLEKAPTSSALRLTRGRANGAARQESREVEPFLHTARDQTIVVVVRIRPKSDKERAQRTFMEVQGVMKLHVPASKTTPTEKTMSFDAVLPEQTSQDQVYQVVGPKLIRNVLEGFNATMIAYGQTGSGKTFTMEGSKKDPGVTPRLCRGLFETIRATASGRRVRVLATYVEIYQESIRDLLDAPRRALSPGIGSRGPSKPGSPTSGVGGTSPLSERGGACGARKEKAIIRENKEGVYVENVISLRVDNEAAVLELLTQGASTRTKAETQMNAASSRSHAVLTLTVVQVPLSGSNDGDESGNESGSNKSGHSNNSRTSNSSGNGGRIGTIRSKISLVDLAGSERAKSTGAAGQRLKEGANINKSLSALGNVIKALTSGGGAHVPYRDSKLTRLLQDSLGGTAYTVVCCNISPVEASESETLSTLRFAERLKKVKNRMVVHMDPKSKELLMLKRENEELRARVRQLEELAGIPRQDVRSPQLPQCPRGSGARTSTCSSSSGGRRPSKGQPRAGGGGVVTSQRGGSRSRSGDADVLGLRTASTGSSHGSPFP